MDIVRDTPLTVANSTSLSTIPIAPHAATKVPAAAAIEASDFAAFADNFAAFAKFFLDGIVAVAMLATFPEDIVLADPKSELTFNSELVAAGIWSWAAGDESAKSSSVVSMPLASKSLYPLQPKYK